MAGSVRVDDHEGNVLANQAGVGGTDIVIEGQTIKYLRESDFAPLANKMITLEFQAKLKEGITAQEIKEALDANPNGIPNEATFRLNGNPLNNKTTDPVYVTPLLGDVTLTKTLDGQAQTTETATFELYKVGTTDTLVGTYTTTNGTIDVRDLIPGDYYFKETVAPDGYTLDATNHTFTIAGGEKIGTNTQVSVEVNNLSKPITVTAKKIWSGGDTGDHGPVTLHLQRQITGQEDTLEYIGDPVQTANDTYTWTNLPPKDENGQAYTYSVVELNPPAGYTPTYGSPAVDDTTGNITIDVTNTYSSDVQDVTAHKEWVNGPADKPEVKLELHRKVGTTDEVVPAENFENGQSAEATLINGVSSYTWTNLPVTNTDGVAYQYYVVEKQVGGVDVVDGLAGDYTVTTNGLFVVNSYNTATKDLTVYKTWVDNNNGENTRPTNITVKAIQSLNNMPTGQGFVITYTYTVDEVNQIPAYTKEVSAPTIDPTSGEISYTITNKFGAGTTDITAYKKWVGGDKDVRPTVDKSLYRTTDPADPAKEEQVSTGLMGLLTGDTVTLTQDVMSHTWEDQPVTDNVGKPYTYYVKELKIGGTEVQEGFSIGGYTSEIDGMVITNTYAPENRDIKVTKAWTGDDDNANNTRQAVEIQLFRNINDGNWEQVGAPVTLNGTEAEPWTHTFTVPRTSPQGQTYEYRVDETSVPVGYEKVGITGNATDGFTITNNYNPRQDQVVIRLNKTLKGKELQADHFNFDLIDISTDTSNTTASQRVANDAFGNIVFAPLTFDSPGTYKYKIVEEEPADKIAGVAYDKTEIIVDVEVKDVDGELVATETYSGTKALPTPIQPKLMKLLSLQQRP